MYVVAMNKQIRAEHERNNAPAVAVAQLKRYGYSSAIMLALLSMGVTLIFGSPTFSLSPATRTFDYFVYPVLIVVGLIVVRAILAGRLPVESFEKPFVTFFAVFFVAKFSFTLLSAPTLLSLAYVESWYWMMVGVWTFSFLAHSFPRAMFVNVPVYVITAGVIVVNTWLKAPPGEFFQLSGRLAASNFRFGAVLAAFVVLGYIKQQWVSVENEAILLRSMALVDALTGLPNRRKLNETLRSVVGAGQAPVTAILFDLDGFKQVNDKFGHNVGDEVLRDIAALARSAVRSDDTVGRWGGEEFLVICPNTSLPEGIQLAERLRHTLAHHETPIDRAITGSFGVAELRPGESAEQLVARADAAMYAAKAKGKDAVYSVAAGEPSEGAGTTPLH